MTLTPEEQDKALLRIRQRLQERKPRIQVLLVEDNDSDAELSLAVLRTAGIAVTWARDSKEVEDYLVANDPWLIFLDLQLSPSDRGELGLNVLGLIKSFKPDCLIIILTGVFQHGSDKCVKALEMGADAVMSKPLTIVQVELLFSSP